jgi:hypothetical protein
VFKEVVAAAEAGLAAAAGLEVEDTAVASGSGVGLATPPPIWTLHNAASPTGSPHVPYPPNKGRVECN